jgi:hypothetical protein
MELDQVPSRYRLRVKQRLAIVAYAVAHGIKPATRRFGLERKTIRRWRERWREAGVAGLVPRYLVRRASCLAPELIRLIEHARRELEYAARARLAPAGSSAERLSRGNPESVPGSRAPALAAGAPAARAS